MSNFDIETSYDLFTYWFKRTSADHFDIIRKADREVVGWLTDTGANPMITINTELDNEAMIVDGDFHKFTTRPEYFVGKYVDVGSFSELWDNYIRLLAGTILIRSYNSSDLHDPDVGLPQVNRAISWLESTDFRDAPASTQYHESYRGGLIHHTLKVYNCMLDLKQTHAFGDVPYDTVTIVALCHDWCKINFYEPYMKNVKNESTGQWEKVEAFKYNQTGIPLGHGVSSMFLASKIVRLSPAEALAIRWHMGKWRCVDAEDSELQNSNKSHPIVHMIQFADQLAITDYVN